MSKLTRDDILEILKQEPKDLPEMPMSFEERADLLFYIIERRRNEEKDTAE